MSIRPWFWELAVKTFQTTFHDGDVCILDRFRMGHVAKPLFAPGTSTSEPTPLLPTCEDSLALSQMIDRHGQYLVFGSFTAQIAASGRYGYQDKDHGHGPNVLSINKLVGELLVLQSIFASITSLLPSLRIDQRWRYLAWNLHHLDHGHHSTPGLARALFQQATTYRRWVF